MPFPPIADGKKKTVRVAIEITGPRNRAQQKRLRNAFRALLKQNSAQVKKKSARRKKRRRR